MTNSIFVVYYYVTRMELAICVLTLAKVCNIFTKLRWIKHRAIRETYLKNLDRDISTTYSLILDLISFLAFYIQKKAYVTYYSLVSALVHRFLSLCRFIKFYHVFLAFNITILCEYAIFTFCFARARAHGILGPKELSFISRAKIWTL